jgi:hypothetical protein
MDVCPKCGRKLKITDLKPECPGCGVNLLYYKIEERLEVDAINAELEHARTQQKLDRAKASLIGSALTIVRIVLLAVVVGMLFLPLATMHAQGPYLDKTFTLNVIEIYNGISAIDFGGLFTILGSAVLGKTFIFYAVSMLMVAVAAVCAIIELIFSFLSCSPHGFSRNLTLAIVGIVSSAVSIVTFNMFLSNAAKVLPGTLTGSIEMGAYLVIAAFVLVIGINIWIKAKGVDVKYKQSYIDSVPYEEFLDNFGGGKYDLQRVESIKEEIEKHQIKELAEG